MKNFKKLIKEAYLGNPLNEIVSRLPVEELTDEALTRLRDQFLTTGTRPNAAEMDLLKSVLDEMNKRGLEESINEVVRGDDFRFIEIKDLHFETDPDRLEDMKIAFGEKMGGFTTKDKIEDAEYELRRFRKEIGFGDGSYSGVFLPGTYDAATSKLGDGPHAKKVSTPKWNERKYEQWIKDVASGGGAEFAYDMAQNAKMEAGLIDWVKKNRLGFGDVTPLERIQYDIEALAESINESVEIPAFMMRDGMYREVVDDSVNFNEFDEKIKSFVGPKFYKTLQLNHPDALEDFFKKYHVTNPNLKEDEDLDINYSDASAGDKSIEDESASGAYESKGFDFKQMVKEALTPKNLR
tara:strand:- start:5 stop:1060 length:1056 start_codon:yes stop_codon:yes gene_type:complete